MTNHPMFEEASPSHRWTGKLVDLAPKIRGEPWGKKGGWVWWVLPHGAVVCARIREEDMRHQVRIARKETPETEDGWKKWEQEVETFAKHLGLEEWERQPDEEGFHKCEVIFTEVHKSEKAKGGKCARCGAPCEHDPTYKEDVCVACARQAGDDETRALAAARAVRDEKRKESEGSQKKPKRTPKTTSL